MIEIPSDYNLYLDLQSNKYKSHEINKSRWNKGQRRYIFSKFSNRSRSEKILDVACGDGVGLNELKQLGFNNIIGIEYEKEKVEFAKRVGFKIYQRDFHDLSIFDKSTFDVVYCSHGLEHALYPDKVVAEFNRILKDDGCLLVVLPYPDTGPLDAHVAKLKLGTDFEDNGEKVINYISNFGFRNTKLERDSYRESEIWLEFIKK